MAPLFLWRWAGQFDIYSELRCKSAVYVGKSCRTGMLLQESAKNRFARTHSVPYTGAVVITDVQRMDMKKETWSLERNQP